MGARVAFQDEHAELRLLILEDSALDAELEVEIIERAGYPCRWDRVQTPYLDRLHGIQVDLSDEPPPPPEGWEPYVSSAFPPSATGFDCMISNPQ